jgi:streptogramin lyase
MRLLTVFLLPLILSAAPKTVSTIAGTGVAGFSGDGGPGVKGQTNNPYGLVIGPDGALYFCEVGNHRVRRLDMKTHRLSTVAGSGAKGYSGDGGPATQALLNEPYEVRFDKAGNMFFVEMQIAVRRVDAKTKMISTVAGNGSPGFAGDGGPAAKAQFKQPHSLAFDPSGALLICDIGNNRIRRIDFKTGLIDTYAGTGEKKPTPDGAPLTGTPLNEPRSMDLDPQGNLYLVLRQGNAVYRIDSTDKKIHHLAGTGEKGNTGDGSDARQAKLKRPQRHHAIPGWRRLHCRYRKPHHPPHRSQKRGHYNGPRHGRGDGPDDPLKCKLARPHGIFVDKRGIVYVSNSEAHRVLVLK